MEVACGDNRIRLVIKEIQRQGKKPQNIGEFMLGSQIKKGAVFKWSRYQLLIEYVGTNFRGWQIQKKGSTIQGLIQDKLTKLLKEKIILNGSGRTDTGVHAIEQSAHFDCKNEILDLIKFLKSINHFLNDQGIAIKKIKKRK